MTNPDTLHLCLLDLAAQLRHFLASPVSDSEAHRDQLWRLRDAALLTLGETRAELSRLSYQAIEPAAPSLPAVWLPSPKMREQLQARRAERTAHRAAPFAVRPREPRP